MRKPRSFLSRFLKITISALCLLGLVILIVLIVQGYKLNWGWTGLGTYISPPYPKESIFQRGKTLWDWLQLLIIPAVLAIGGYTFTYSTSRNEQKSIHLRDQTERDIAADNQREAALQAYIDKMSELLLEKQLRESKPEDEVCTIGRVRTLTVLRRLDAERKGSVLKFLKESSLIDCNKCIIDLSHADLSGAYLRGAFLHEANLSEVNLSEADLSGAILSGARLGVANLTGADLSGAFLYGANLTGADLSWAKLKDAKITHEEEWEKAKSLKGATMPDGSIHS